MRPDMSSRPETTVYLTLDPAAGPPWAESEACRRLTEALAAEGAAEDERVARLAEARACFDEIHHIRPAVVAGPVVFEYTFTRPGVPIGSEARLRRIPLARWRIHRPAPDRFVVVVQRRRKLSPTRAARWQDHLDPIANAWRGAGLHEAAVATRSFVESSEDVARWTATIEAPMALDGLLAWCDAASDVAGRPHGPNDEVSVPFLVRKALIERGVDVPGATYHGFD